MNLRRLNGEETPEQRLSEALEHWAGEMKLHGGFSELKPRLEFAFSDEPEFLSEIMARFAQRAVLSGEASSVPPRYEGKELENFDGIADVNKELGFDVRRWPWRESSENGWSVTRGRALFVIYGFTGTGKTHLATAILNRAHRAGFSTLWADHREWLFEAKRAIGEDRYARFVSQAREVPFLLLDDWHLEGSDWEKSESANIVLHRHNYVRPTILTTNTAPEQIRIYDERLHSRMFLPREAIQLKRTGKDRRAEEV